MKKGNKVKVFYTPKQVVSEQNVVMSTSKSPLKPRLLMENFEKLGLTAHMDVDGSFAPYCKEEFAIAHRQEWIDVFINGKPGCQSNSIPWSEELAKTVLYTNASLYNAIRHSIMNPDVPCFSPTSGFHHATPHSGRGFCTFAGQVVASVKLYREFGISGAYLDLDGHFGNSIEDCRVFQPEINKAVPILKIGETSFNCNVNLKGYDESYVKCLEDNLDILEALILRGEIGYVVWCHGADSHIDDDLGGQVDTKHWVKSSEVFFNWVQKVDEKLAAQGRPSLPVTMSLFGGYRKDSYSSVLSLHTRDMVECLNVLCGTDIKYEAEVKSKRAATGDDFWNSIPVNTNVVAPKTETKEIKTEMSPNEKEVLSFLEMAHDEGIEKFWKGYELGWEIKQWKNHSMGKWAMLLLRRGVIEGTSRKGYKFKK